MTFDKGEPYRLDWGHWNNETGVEPMDLEEYFGFVYQLTFNDGRTYIGRKRFHTRRRLPPLKGKKRARIKYGPSKWRSYSSSSRTVHDRLLGDPECIVRRDIIGIFSSASTLNLGETTAICLGRIYLGDRGRPLNERIEAVRGGYRATDGDADQLTSIVRRYSAGGG